MSLARFFFLIGAFFCLLAAPSMAAAQWKDHWGTNWNNPISSYLGNVNYFRVFSHPGSSTRSTSTRNPQASTNASPANLLPAQALSFKTSGPSGVDVELAKTLSNDPVEQSQLVGVLEEVKKQYEQEIRDKGKKPDIAMALTFYLEVCVSAYTDAPDPSDETDENIYRETSGYLLKQPELGEMSDRDKQQLHDRLVYVGGLIGLGYLTGKQENNPQIIKSFRTLAGTAIQALLKVDPARVRLANDNLIIN